MTSYLLVLNEIRKAGQNAKQAIEDINKSVTDLQIATNMNRDSVKDLVKGYNDYGKALGSTTTQITSAADDYFRAGKTLNEAQSLIKDSIMLSKLGQISSGEATEDLLAVMNGYAMSIDEVGKALDTMVALDMKAATSSGKIATALKYCASSADVAGVSFDKLASMIATVKDKTQQSAETVGTFMNTLLSRYRDVKLGQFTSDDGEDLSDVESILGTLDIKLRDSREEFRNFEDIINEAFASLFHRFVFYDDSGIEVNPSRFVFSQSGVGGNLHGRNKRTERSTAAGSEEHHVTAAGGEGGGSYQIVARCGKQVQTFHFQAVAIAHNSVNVCFAAFLGTSQRFVFQGGDTTCLVAR